MSSEQTTDVVPAGSDEGDAWDAYFDNSEVARMCPCTSCNYYLPPEEYKPDSECEETTLIKAIVAAARADERERALTEAADAWVGGEWRPVLHNDAREDLTVAGRVTKWLRDRAALAQADDACKPPVSPGSEASA